MLNLKVLCIHSIFLYFVLQFFCNQRQQGRIPFFFQLLNAQSWGLSVSVRCFCWSWVLVHITLSHRDGVLVQKEGSHCLIMLLILGTRKRCLESFGPDSKCWSGTLCSLFPWVKKGWFWYLSKLKETIYNIYSGTSKVSYQSQASNMNDSIWNSNFLFTVIRVIFFH